MRRSMVSMLVVLGALSTSLRAQSAESGGAPVAGSALGFAFTTTIGTGWQIQLGEIGYVRRTGGGPVRALWVSARLGSFVDEGAIIGGSRGFVAAGTVGLRSPRAVFAELGDDLTTTRLGIDLSLEASGYVSSNSPLPVGPRWVALSVLPGLRASGGGGGPEYSVVFGPSVFIGRETEVRALFAFRLEMPLARGERHP